MSRREILCWLCGDSTGQGYRAELPALACAHRAEDPRQSCVEGKSFLQKSPSKEPHFTDVSWAAQGSWGTVGSLDTVMRCSEAAVGS